MIDLSQIESILLAALGQKTIAERAGDLDHVCGDDAELRRRVERLLDAFRQAADYLAQPAVRHEDNSGQHGPPDPAPTTPPEVTAHRARMADRSTITDLTPTESETNGRSPAPNDVDFRTLADPQATSDEKAQPIADAGSHRQRRGRIAS